MNASHRTAGSGRSPARGCSGFTLVEVMLVTSMLMTILATFAVGIRAGHATNEEMERRSLTTAMSGDLMDRMFQVGFGVPAGGSATTEQLDELFDDDSDLGMVTLSALRISVTSPGHRFQLTGFPFEGTWEVRVTGDLNNDGDEMDSLEGQPDIMRIDILFEGQLILETIRTAPVG